MSEAWSLFARSLSKAWSEFWPFVKIWFTTVLVIFALIFIVSLFYRDDIAGFFYMAAQPEMVTTEMQMNMLASMGSIGFWGLVFAVLGFIAASGLSVNSLRYYAGSYTPSWRPFQFDWSATFAVLGWSIVLLLIAAVILIIPAAVMEMLSGAAVANGSRFLMILGYLIYICSLFLTYWIIIRLFNKIVARALDDMISFGEAWNKTKGSALFFFGLALFVVIFIFLFSFLSGLIFGLLFAIFTSPAWLAFVMIVFLLFMTLFEIYIYAVYYAISIAIYRKYFGKSLAI